MDDDEALIVDHAEGNKPDLAIVCTVIDPGKYLTFKDLGRIEHVDAALPDDLLPLLFIPFQFHEPPPISQH